MKLGSFYVSDTIQISRCYVSRLMMVEINSFTGHIKIHLERVSANCDDLHLSVKILGTEGAARSCFVKKVFLKVSQNSQENTYFHTARFLNCV